jgi:hypothetical protein
MSPVDDKPVTWLPPVAPGTEPPRPVFEPASVAPARPRTDPRAVWALVLAVAGLSLLLVSLGTLFILTLPLSTAAWVLALRVGAAEGGQAVAALWIARIGVIAGVAAAVVFIALLASGFDFDQFRDDVQRKLDEQRDTPSNGVRATAEGLRTILGR